MCGISGFIDSRPSRSEQELRALVRSMSTMLRHRGPDDEGVWTDPGAGIALGFRRLAILDLTAAGHQPMMSSSGRQVMVFNGEVYNHPELRQDLGRVGATFRGHSDTEVLLEAIQRWGVPEALGRTTGMFALAVWDTQRQVLTLARDRMGEKPLYYGWVGDTFFFASELKAMRAHPGFRAGIDRSSLALYLRYGYVPTPYSIFQGIAKLVPGTTLEVRPNRPRELPDPIPYWSLYEAVETGLREPLDMGDDEAVDHLEQLLKVSVAHQMVADVPVGAFLSGGIDSSTVVALMQAQSSRPVRTFTVGFNERGFDEAVHAKKVAAHLGTDHTELYITPDEARQVIPRLPEIYDEPFADSSQIPTFLIAELARRDVTVSLSGDGGDELFGGYDRYRLYRRLSRTAFRVPFPLRRGAAELLMAVPPWRWDSAAALLPGRMSIARAGDRVHKLAGALKAADAADLYRHLMSHWKDPSGVVIDGDEPSDLLGDSSAWPVASDAMDRVMFVDAVTYLPDDILVKVDRATMAVSLEARVPLLDRHLVEFAWSLPQEMKLRHGRGKWLLRRVLERHVPPNLTERPKMGFGVPIGEWLRGPLRDWAEELLDPGRLASERFFHVDTVRLAWNQHLGGRSDRQHELWNVLMFEAWLDGISSPPPIVP